MQTKDGTVTISMTNVYISSQKMLYNIMRSNILMCEALGMSKARLKDELFEIDPKTDLGIYDVKKVLMDPEKC